MAIELWRTRPYTVGSLNQTVDRLFDQAFSPAYSRDNEGGSTAFQSLPINVWETNEGFQAVLLAPGLNEQTLSVTVHEEMLTIEGDIAFQVPEDAKALWQEFGPSKVRRSVRLGSVVDAAKVEALYRNGMLLVTLPKLEQVRPRQITVKTDAAAKETAKKS